MTTIGFKPNGETLSADAITGSPTQLYLTQKNVDFTVYRYPTNDGTLTRAGVHIASGADGSRQIRIALYDAASNNLLAYATLTPPSGHTGEYYGDLNTPVSVSIATEYRMAFQISNGNLNINRQDVAIFWRLQTVIPAFNDPLPDPISDSGSTTSTPRRGAIWMESAAGNTATISWLRI